MPEYPGAGRNLRLEIDWNKLHYPIGHPGCRGANSDMLLVREVAMMAFIEKITDKPDWHLKIFDPEITAKYTEEALNWPIDDLYDHISLGGRQERSVSTMFNEKTIDYCIRELRAKATYFKVTGMIPTLDACYTIVKSDVLVDDGLREELRASFDRLRVEQASNPDWHPHSGEMVQDLVHPSMYPFVYGRSPFVADEVVGVDDAIDKWAGKGDILPKPPLSEQGHGTVLENSWSTNYQWLPSNLRFKEEGGVEFTSYINNLHPVKHRDIYHTIEKLINEVLPMWNQCLARYKSWDERIGPGHLVPRFPIPDRVDDDDEENWDPPKPRKSTSDENWELSNDESDDDGPELARWVQTRKAVQPEVGDYEPEPGDYVIQEAHRLETLFKDTGLQVIVKIASIELGSSKPVFPLGSWHIEGQMNERIVGTALYYVDSENIMPTQLQFRMSTDWEDIQDWYGASNDRYQWLERVYGTKFSSYDDGRCLQNYGLVDTRPGRLLAFPNVFQHRSSWIELDNPSKPGRRSFIALWLVNPVTRIISTANVPPQREDWLAENAFDNGTGTSNAEKNSRIYQLPGELTEMVHEEVRNSRLMGDEEAKEHRLKLMEERTNFQEKSHKEWQQRDYNFCEH
ncbi:hypothetical protein PT974_05856 [Cladobotryum mycophilum]|uniref:Duf1665 domain containing protein n=1 Tax=Cladobotryum mycophilum TaxID=491253 RepID=A0ABR0SJX3_9HYPO